MKSENQVVLEFPSRSSNEAFARVAAAGFAMQLDPTLEELGDIKTAVSEAVTNAIVHGYPEGFGRVVMKLRIKEGNILEIVVRDWGVGIADVEQALDQVIFIDHGRIVLQSDTDLIRAEKGMSVDALFREVFKCSEN